MTRSAARLAELDAVSRERSLTDAEVAEVKRLAHLERQCARRRHRYATDPDYRGKFVTGTKEAWAAATRTCEQCGKVFGRKDKPGVIYGAFMRLRFCSPECSADSLRADPVASFWSRVRKTDTCWLWTGQLSPKGYGVLWDGQTSKRAHRFSYQLATGIDPEDGIVMHSCDVRHCVNPAHLRLGTQAENVADMDRKGRRNPPRGSQHGQTKLTEAQVLEIRRDPRTCREIAADYPIGKPGVEAIRAGRTWRHLCG